MSIDDPDYQLTNDRLIFFQVLINYTEDDKEDESHVLESMALNTIGEADDIIRNTAERFSTKYPGCSVIELEPEELTDDDQFHILIKTGDRILVKLGIVAVDYTGVTIH